MHFIQIVINITTRHILEEEINSEFILKDVVHRIYKRVLRLKENLLFDFYVFDLVLLQDNVFIEPLHRIYFLGYLILHQKNFPKRTFINHFFYDKVSQSYRGAHVVLTAD